MITSLVTGGAGFIGAHVAIELIEMGHQVIILDDLSGGFVENVPDGAVFIDASVIDNDLIIELFEEHRFDYVYHLAAYAAEGLSHFIRRFNYQNNLLGSINLINASIKYNIKCFVFTSSIAVYGDGNLPLREHYHCVPEDPYGIAKLAIEQDLRCAYELFGLNYIIFRPHNVYGEFQNIGDKYRNVVGIFMNQILSGKDLTIFGDGKQTRAFTYISDVAPVIAQSILNNAAFNEIFNLGADIHHSVNQLADLIIDVFNSKAKKNILPARQEVKHAYCSHDKLKKIFGMGENFISLEDGVERMAAWVKKVGSRESRIFSDIEITKHLPPSWR